MHTYLTNYIVVVYGYPCKFISFNRISDVANYVKAKLRHGSMLTSITCNNNEIVNVETYIYAKSGKSYHMFGMNPCREKLDDEKTYIDIGTDWWDIFSDEDMKSIIENAANSKKDDAIYTEWFISECSEHINNYAGPFGCEFADIWNSLHPECIIYPYNRSSTTSE